MQKEKKRLLGKYLIQEAKIQRLKEMITLNPEKSEHYKKEIEECKALRRRIESAVNSVDEPVLKELLYQRYILGKTIEEITFIINYSLRHTERLHSKAIDKIIITLQEGEFDI